MEVRRYLFWSGTIYAKV